MRCSPEDLLKPINYKERLRDSVRLSVPIARHDDDDDDDMHKIWFGWLFWHIDHCRLFNAKSTLKLKSKVGDLNRG